MTRVRVKSEDRSRAIVYFTKCERFADAARQNAHAQNWDPAAANAVNAIINLVDALCVHYQGQRNAGGSHHDALGLLRGLAELDAKTRAALDKHLGALLSVKSLAQYEGRLMGRMDTDDAISHMERALRAVRELPPIRAWTEGVR